MVALNQKAQQKFLPGPSTDLWRKGRNIKTKRKGPNIKYTKRKSPAAKKIPPKKKKSPKRKKKSPKKKGEKLTVKMNFPKGKKNTGLVAITVGHYHDSGESHMFESPKRRSPRLSPQGASRTDDTSLSSAGSSFSNTIIAPKSSSSSTVFEPASPFAPTHTSTAAPPKKREKYHCSFCLDAFPTKAQRDMHEINKHNAWLYHPTFLSPSSRQNN